MKFQRSSKAAVALVLPVVLGLISWHVGPYASAGDQVSGHVAADLAGSRPAVASVAHIAVGNKVHVQCEPGTDIADDIQTAVNYLKPLGGGTIYLPQGEFQINTMVRVPGGIAIIGQGKDQTKLYAAPRTTMITVSTRTFGGKGLPTRISGIAFYNLHDVTGISGNAIICTDCIDYRIDHCLIQGQFSSGIRIVGNPFAYHGVIDHCDLVMDNAGSYGVSLSGDDETWVEDVGTVYGTENFAFIEDCTFWGAHHAVRAGAAAHYVFRNNTVIHSNGHPVDAHGYGFGANRGTRVVEVYNNYINETESTATGIAIRGGAALIYGNTIRNFNDQGIFLIVEQWIVDAIKAGTMSGDYPIKDQVHDVWIWDNTFLEPGRFGDIVVKEDSIPWIVENRDFFLRAPSQAQDGFTYRPYVYPHPLTQELTLRGTPANQTINLNWEVCASLPASSTWQISYYSETVSSPVTITDIVSTTRANTLTGLTNYEWYTVTLNAMVDATPFLTSTVRVMPTDKFTYLPLVLQDF